MFYKHSINIEYWNTYKYTNKQQLNAIKSFDAFDAIDGY